MIVIRPPSLLPSVILHDPVIFREPVSPLLTNISNDGLSGGGGGPAPRPTQPSAPYSALGLSASEQRGLVQRDLLVGGLSLAARWGALAGLCAVGALFPWSLVLLGLAVGTSIVNLGIRRLGFVLFYNPDTFDVLFHIKLRRIEEVRSEIAQLKDETLLSPQEKLRRYEDACRRLDALIIDINDMVAFDPGRAFANNLISGVVVRLYDLFMLIRGGMENVDSEWRGREFFARSYRKFAKALPRDLPRLPPEPSNEGGYRELPANLRVELTPEQKRLEARIDDADALLDDQEEELHRRRR